MQIIKYSKFSIRLRTKQKHKQERKLKIMACRNAYTIMTTNMEKAENKIQPVTAEKTVTRLLFGIDTKIETDDLLQNNITQFEWAVRNKIYPKPLTIRAYCFIIIS